MVAILKPKIYTGQVEDLGEELRAEIKGMLKQVAFEHNCSVEELKYRVSNDGMVNIQKMTEQEMIDMEAKRQLDKKIKMIRKMKGLD